MRPDEPCPCGSGETFGICCSALHAGGRHAQTAEQLMRSRYSAYAVGDADYIWRTWHPRTRPESIVMDPDVTWTGLEIVDCVDGLAGDGEGEVEFRARYCEGRLSAVLHERSQFSVRARRWFYVDGQLFGRF